MRDHYFGYRDFFTGEVLDEEVVWTDWDYALAGAVQTIEDFTDGDGLLPWEKDDDNVVVEAVRKVNRFDAAKTRRTGAKRYKPIAGEYFVPQLTLLEGDEWPTLEEWAQKQAEDAQQELDSEYPEPEEVSFISGS